MILASTDGKFSWVPMFALVMKMTILSIKLGIITWISLQAYTIRHKKFGGKFDLISLVLLLNVTILLSVAAVDLTVRYISVFFALIYLANYVNFVAYNVLIRNVKLEEGNKLKQNTNPFYIFMNCVYLVNFLCSFILWYGPFCEVGRIYPPCMTTANVLVWVNYIYHLWLTHKDYYLKWN